MNLTLGQKLIRTKPTERVAEQGHAHAAGRLGRSIGLFPLTMIGVGATMTLLFLPKVLIVIDAGLRGRARGFGGTMRAIASTLTELLFSSITAPLFLMFETRSVMQVLRGADGGWPAQTRGDGTLGFGDAWAASHWIVTTGVVVLGAAQWFAPALVLWLLPVALPSALISLRILSISLTITGARPS